MMNSLYNTFANAYNVRGKNCILLINVISKHLHCLHEDIISNFYYHDDLPQGVILKGDIAVDTEAMGLNNLRDRLCVIQISDGGGDAHIIHFAKSSDYSCPNLRKVLFDKARQKIFHFARFDVAIIQHYMKTQIENVYCTKIASKLARTYTDSHGLKDLCSELLDIRISKQQQSSDWGANLLTNDQIVYAGADVLHLHALRKKLNTMLARESRLDIALQCMNFIPTRAALDIMGWLELDIFAH